MFQAVADNFQDIITGFVAVAVIEFFKVINIHHGNGIGFPQIHETFIKLSPTGQARQFIMVGQKNDDSMLATTSVSPAAK
ncbi:MAG: hypothetical protein R2861_02520 [Desulfobacterales bacterium]